jgi:hypothetical protein
MRQDTILEIGLDKLERLYIKPKTERFPMIYRSACEVHWDNDVLYLSSPKPREWSYLDWYKHIYSLIQTGYDCKLTLSTETNWINIKDTLRQNIEKVI